MDICTMHEGAYFVRGQGEVDRVARKAVVQIQGPSPQVVAPGKLEVNENIVYVTRLEKGRRNPDAKSEPMLRNTLQHHFRCGDMIMWTSSVDHEAANENDADSSTTVAGPKSEKKEKDVKQEGPGVLTHVQIWAIVSN